MASQKKRTTKSTNVRHKVPAPIEKRSRDPFPTLEEYRQGREVMIRCAANRMLRETGVCPICHERVAHACHSHETQKGP